MIGIIGAMASEVDGLKNKMTDMKTETFSGIDFCSGKVCGRKIVVAQAGVGKVNAAVTAQTMILKYGVGAVINIGVAGGIEESLKIGDMVVAERVVEHDMDTTAVGDEPGFISGINRVYMDCDSKMVREIADCANETGVHTVCGTIASGDIFVAGSAVRNRISELFGAAAAEMEGAAIGHVCTMNDIPFVVLRSMSDCANDDSKVDFPVFAAAAAEKSIEIITRFLAKGEK